jgi:Zn-dependent M28 family amino/carboxypeptidase
MKKYLLFLVVCLLLASCLQAQEREDRTLLSWEQMRAVINEASGERAMHHVLELVPYPRIRPRSEWETRFRESEVMARFAKEYGFSNVEVETFPSGQSWLATQGELWIVKPETSKLYDIYDVAVSLCSGSQSGDVTAELADVGVGSNAGDYAGKEVKGKIVLGSAGASSLARLAVAERGALGVVSYWNMGNRDSFPDQVLTQSISGRGQQDQPQGFGWSISPRVGRELAARLARGEKITLRSVVKAETAPGRMEVVHATIPGDGSTDQAIAVSAHLYEGYIKQGANDDSSGCAVTLEMGRALIRLVKEGKLPPVKRTVHFLWVPEISGTMAWLRAHEDVRKKLIADLNFDMEGLGLRMGFSSWVLHRTPDTVPTFLNDVAASILEFVANTNRERVNYRHHGYAFSLPVLAPNGSRDPFYVNIVKYYGASDHMIYLRQGIPAAMFVTWPDPWYHSSQDTPDKLDSTQFKRAAVVGTAAMSVLASAGDEMAARVAAESLARGAERMGQAQGKGLGYVADTADAAGLREAWREAQVAIRHQAGVEKGVVRSAAVLFANPEEAGKKLVAFETLIDQRAAALENEAAAFYRLRAEQQKARPVELALNDAEKQAARTLVEQAGDQAAGGGFGRFRAAEQALEKLSPDDRKFVQAARAKFPPHMSEELGVLLGQKKTALQIRDFLAGEFEPLPLADLMDYLRAQEKLGQLKLSIQPQR